jgi:hypothetical protein
LTSAVLALALSVGTNLLVVQAQEFPSDGASTKCQDNAAIPNTGYCTLLDPTDTGHQDCVDSETMKTCDGAG